MKRVELSLELLELHAVLRLIGALRHVELTEDRRLAEDIRPTRLLPERWRVAALGLRRAVRRSDGIACPLTQPLLDRVVDAGRDRQAAIALVRTFYDRPGRIREARARDDLFGRIDETAVQVPVVPLFRCHAPAGERIFLQLLEPGLL